MQYRSVQPSNAIPFKPRTHTGIILTVSGPYSFVDRNQVPFSLTVDSSMLPFHLPLAVGSMTSAPAPNAALFLL